MVDIFRLYTAPGNLRWCFRVGHVGCLPQTAAPLLMLKGSHRWKKKSVLTLWLGDFRIQFEYPNIVQSILTRTQRFIATSVDHYHYHDSAIRVGKLGRHVNNKNTCFFCPHVSVSYQFSPSNTLHWFCTASAAHAFEESLQLQLAKHQVWVTELLFVWRMSRDACSTLQLCSSGMISRTPYDKIVRNARRCRGAYFENTMWLTF